MSETGINDKAAPYVDRIREVKERLASLKGKYMSDCKVLNEEIKEIKTEAVDDGIRRKALNKILERLDLEHKIEAIDDALEDEDLDQYQALVESLGRFGELPLVGAALKRAKGEKSEAEDPGAQAGKKGRGRKGAPALTVASSSSDEDPRPAFLKDKEAKRVEESTRLIKDGIKPLDDKTAPTIQ